MEERSDSGSVQLGGLIVQARTRAKLSQSELARRVGYDHSALSRFERGERMPSRRGLIRILDALGLGHYERAVVLVTAGFWPFDIPADVELLAALAVLIDRSNR